MSNSLTILIVEKTGNVKEYNVKSYKEEDLFKKCGYKKSEGFTLQTQWSVKIDKRYTISLFGKTDGKANMENKYDFPPPVDNVLYFGCCALICTIKNESGEVTPVNLSVQLWNKIYEKLFGGFEDLASESSEEDELQLIHKSKKTKVGGYLKDGFVVDDVEFTDEEEEENDDNHVEPIGSELSEEDYDYSDTESD
jgi:hypothetical protein